MSNFTAFGLAVIIVAAITADQLLWSGVGGMWVARSFIDFLETLAFWR